MRNIADIRSLHRLARQMSGAFRDSMGGGIVERFESVSKLLFLNIYVQNHPEIEQGSKLFVTGGKQSNRAVYERARTLWNRIQYRDHSPTRTECAFPEDVDAVAKCIDLLADTDFSGFDTDIRGRVYEELLNNTFEKNENQQYFTPINIVQFIMEFVKDVPAQTVLDPACGSGGFLTAYHHGCRGGKNNTRLVGIDVDARMCWVARTNLLAHDAPNSEIYHMAGAGSLGDERRIRRLLDGGADLILENPPFGSDVTDPEILAMFGTGKNRSSRRRSVLFLERSISLLNDGGFLAIVLDDSVLNLDSNRDIRAIVRRSCAVKAVISLPGVAFAPYSTANSSILILQKGEEQGTVFMARATEVGRRQNGEPLYDEAGELVSDLDAIAQKWQRYQSEADLENDDLGFVGRLENDKGTRLDVSYYHPSRFTAQEILSDSPHQLISLGEAFSFISGSHPVGKELGDEPISWLGLADIEKVTGTMHPKTVRASSIKSNVHKYESGDILFSRLRPELRKVVYCVDPEGFCSSELVVLRIKDEYRGKIDPEYVSVVLRGDVTYGQIVFKVTGLGRPRIGIPNLKGILIPVPELSEQQRVAARYRDSMASFRQLCREVEDRKADAFRTLVGIQNSSAH